MAAMVHLDGKAVRTPKRLVLRALSDLPIISLLNGKRRLMDYPGLHARADPQHAWINFQPSVMRPRNSFYGLSTRICLLSRRRSGGFGSGAAGGVGSVLAIIEGRCGVKPMVTDDLAALQQTELLHAALTGRLPLLMRIALRSCSSPRRCRICDGGAGSGWEIDADTLFALARVEERHKDGLYDVDRYGPASAAGRGCGRDRRLKSSWDLFIMPEPTPIPDDLVDMARPAPTHRCGCMWIMPMRITRRSGSAFIVQTHGCGCIGRWPMWSEGCRALFARHGARSSFMMGCAPWRRRKRCCHTRVKDNLHWLEEPRLLSPPGAGGHLRGMAIDIGLEDAQGRLLDMGTVFDYLAEDSRRPLICASRICRAYGCRT